MRRFCIFVAAVILASLFAPIQQIFMPQPASAAVACAPNDIQWTPGVRGEKPRCVFNTERATRRRIETNCLNSRPPLGTYIYDNSHECSKSIGIEAIGQSRALKFISDRLGQASPPGPGNIINPSIQWETSFGRSDRSDIVQYDLDGSNFAEVIEAKVKGNPTYKGWLAQVSRYSSAIRSGGVRNVAAGNILNRLAGGTYQDAFQVYDKERTCQTSTGEDGYILKTFIADSRSAGLLHIEEVEKVRKCEKDKSQPPPNSTEVEIPVEEPDELDLPKWPIPVAIAALAARISTVAPATLAGDVAAYGSVEAAAATMTAQIERFLATRAGAAILAEAGFLTARLAIASLGVVGVLLLIYLYLLYHDGGSIKGEPHFVTPDGLSYDLQSVGEFVLARSEKYGLEVQGRLSPASGGRDVSVMFQAAMEVNDHIVEFDEDDLIVDGQAQNLEDGHILYLGEDSYIIRKGKSHVVAWDGVDGPLLSWKRGFVNLWVPPSPDNDLEGLLGNSDGDPSNDLRLKDGTQLPADASATVLHTDFADSWRISNDESLFTYGEGESTETFTDRTFPQSYVTIHDLSAEQIVEATAKCEEAGVQAGPPFNGCILDLALTADDSFASSAAQRQGISLDPQAQKVNADGDLDIDFEAANLAANVVPARLSKDPSATAFAGPFSGTASYRFFVQSLPSHAAGSLAFDLLTVGDWSADEDVETVTVATDRSDPYIVKPSELTPTGSGTLASGVPYSKYRVTIPFDHIKSQIEFKVSASGVAGISNQAFGIDNVNLNLEVVPLQMFETSLPLNIEDGQPAAGAGNLETAVSKDGYRFTAPANGRVYIDAKVCPGDGSALDWDLLAPDNTVVASHHLCSGRRIDNLQPGAYRLIVYSQDEKAGTYSLSVTPIAPDTTAQLTAGGTESTVTTTDPGQYAWWTFTGTANQQIALQFSNGSLPKQGDAYVWVKSPDGSVLAEQKCGMVCFFDKKTLPTNGTYTVVWDPAEAKTGSMTAQLFDITDVSAQASVDGPASVLATTAPGQNGKWTFTGTTGQRIAFNFTDSTLSSRRSAYVKVTNPDGTELGAGSPCGTNCLLEPTVLPADGTYTVTWDPQDALTGSLALKIQSVTDTAAALTIGGPTSTLTTTVPGQNGSWTFAGLAGQRVHFNFTDGSFGISSSAKVTVNKPDGTALLGPKICGRSCSFDTTILPIDGIYTIALNPEDTHTGSLTAQLTDVPETGAEASITIGGPAETITIAAAGQNGTWRFLGTAGQRVYFNFTGGNFGTSARAKVTVTNPDGTTLLPATNCGTTCNYDTTALPADGTYTITLNPTDAHTGTLTAQLYQVPADITAATSVNGPASTLSIGTPGQNGSWTFTGTAGQRVYFNFTGGNFGTSARAKVTVTNPDGTTLLPATNCGTTCNYDTTALPADGTYTITLNPTDAHTGTLTAQLYQAPAD